MKGIETGNDKVKKICDLLKKETIDPARKEAEEIVARAQEKAALLISEAKKEVEGLHADARDFEERQKNIFQAALNAACKQTIEILKESIEEKLFNKELASVFGKNIKEPVLLARLIEAVTTALEKDGINADLSVYIPAAVPARDVNTLLGEKILARLREKSVLLSNIEGGVEVKLHKDNITIDVSDVALRELVSRYIRKDFREMLFGKRA